MKSKHTPGPWNKIQGIDQTAADIRTESGIMVATVFGNDMGRTKANARLIAAAPDLLAALQEFERYQSPMITSTYGREVLGRVRAAITKATGEGPCA